MRFVRDQGPELNSGSSWEWKSFWNSGKPRDPSPGNASSSFEMRYAHSAGPLGYSQGANGAYRRRQFGLVRERHNLCRVVEITEYFTLGMEPVLLVQPINTAPCLVELISSYPDPSLRLGIYPFFHHVLKHCRTFRWRRFVIGKGL